MVYGFKCFISTLFVAVKFTAHPAPSIVPFYKSFHINIFLHCPSLTPFHMRKDCTRRTRLINRAKCGRCTSWSPRPPLSQVWHRFVSTKDHTPICFNWLKSHLHLSASQLSEPCAMKPCSDFCSQAWRIDDFCLTTCPEQLWMASMASLWWALCMEQCVLGIHWLL